MGENDGPTRPVPQLWTQNRITMMPIDTPTTASAARITQLSGVIYMCGLDQCCKDNYSTKVEP